MTMSRPDARLIVWHPETTDVIADVSLQVRAVVSDEVPESVVYELSSARSAFDVEVEPSWLGMSLTIELSPKAVTTDTMTSLVADVAKRMGVPVG